MSEKSHCKDCCCAQSWAALGVTEYTGKSIPEHITQLRETLAGEKDKTKYLEGQVVGIAAALGFRDADNDLLKEAVLSLRGALARAEGEREEAIADIQSGYKAVVEMNVLMDEGSAAIAKLSSHPAVARLCMELRKKEAAEQERDQLQFQLDRYDARLEKMLAAVRKVAGQRDGFASSVRCLANTLAMTIKERDYLKQCEAVLDINIEALGQERDTLKTELAEAQSNELKERMGRIEVEAQLTQAEEAKKATAVQMTGLAERADKFMWQVRDTCTRAERAEAQLTTSREEGYRQGWHDALNGVFQINGPSRAIAQLRKKYAGDTPVPQGGAFQRGMERAVEIVESKRIHKMADVDSIIDAIRAESSTLPRTYEQEPK